MKANELKAGNKFKTWTGSIVEVIEVLPSKKYAKGLMKGKETISVITNQGPFFFLKNESVNLV